MNDAPILDTEPSLAPEAQSPAPSTWKKYLKSTQGKIVCILIILVALFLVATQQVYSRSVDDPFVHALSQVIPYPALSVNGQKVSMKEFLAEYEALKQYFAQRDSSSSLPPDQLEIAVADTLVNKIAIAQLAQERGLEVDQARVEKYYADVLASQESEEAFVKELEETFGWTTDEFKKRIVESIVLALQMSEAILQDESIQTSRKALLDAANERVKNGEDFQTVAKEIHGRFPSSGLESDLGYIKLSLVPESWKSAVEALPTGGMTDILELPEGYAIFFVEDRIVTSDDTQLHLFGITVPKQTLEDVVKAYLETANVKKYVGT